MDCKKQIKLITYNVWSREDVVLYTRMQAIGRLVHEHSPDVILFQEFTQYILDIFKSSPWLAGYSYFPECPSNLQEGEKFCMIFSKHQLTSYGHKMFGSMPVRYYLEAYVNPKLTGMKPILIATAQLEPPTPPAPMHFVKRYSQAEDILAKLSGQVNVVFGGDMSWDDKADRPFPLRAGWVDAAYSFGERSWTYDAFLNEEARDFNGCVVDYESMRKRSDRFLCKLQDYKLNSIQLIGDEPIGVEYRKKLDGVRCSLMPSCHRGLVLTIVPK